LFTGCGYYLCAPHPFSAIKKANPFCTRLAFVFKKTNFSSTVSLGLEG
jgi:hypothetical protein